MYNNYLVAFLIVCALVGGAVLCRVLRLTERHSRLLLAVLSTALSGALAWHVGLAQGGVILCWGPYTALYLLGQDRLLQVWLPAGWVVRRQVLLRVGLGTVVSGLAAAILPRLDLTEGGMYGYAVAVVALIVLLDGLLCWLCGWNRAAGQAPRPVESVQEVERRLEYRITDLMNTMALALACLRLEGAREAPNGDAALVRAEELLDQYAHTTLPDGRDAREVMLLMLQHEARQHRGKPVSGCNYCDPDQ